MPQNDVFQRIDALYWVFVRIVCGYKPRIVFLDQLASCCCVPDLDLPVRIILLTEIGRIGALGRDLSDFGSGLVQVLEPDEVDDWRNTFGCAVGAGRRKGFRVVVSVWQEIFFLVSS